LETHERMNISDKSWTKVSPHYRRGNLWCFARWQWLNYFTKHHWLPFQ